MGETLFDKYEKELWHIVRMHSFQISITIVFTPDYGVPFYTLTLVVKSNPSHIHVLRGQNLYKRYKKCIELLQAIYGNNLYKYDTNPLLNDKGNQTTGTD